MRSESQGCHKTRPQDELDKPTLGMVPVASLVVYLCRACRALLALIVRAASLTGHLLCH
jgi:hypothetical protein